MTVSVPITHWWGGSHSIKKQKLEVINAENTLSDNSQLLEIAMYKSWFDLSDAYQGERRKRNSVTLKTEHCHSLSRYPITNSTSHPHCKDGMSRN